MRDAPSVAVKAQVICHDVGGTQEVLRCQAVRAGGDQFGQLMGDELDSGEVDGGRWKLGRAIDPSQGRCIIAEDQDAGLGRAGRAEQEPGGNQQGKELEDIVCRFVTEDRRAWGDADAPSRPCSVAAAKSKGAGVAPAQLVGVAMGEAAHLDPCMGLGQEMPLQVQVGKLGGRQGEPRVGRAPRDDGCPEPIEEMACQQYNHCGMIQAPNEGLEFAKRTAPVVNDLLNVVGPGSVLVARQAYG